MAINMNTIPDSKPSGMNTIFPKGSYIATINKATMKQGKDKTKPPYFSAECDITDPASNTGMGKFWINLYESEAQLCRYQIGRFLKALNLNLQGEFELSDLTKMVNGKQLIVDICPDKDGSKSVVDISAECFYPITGNPVDNSQLDEVAEEINSVFTAPIGQSETVPARASSY